MDQAIKAGFSGFIIATIIIFFLPVDLYFLPEFVASIVAIYVFGLKAIKDGLLAAFTTYIFTEWIVGSVALAIFFVSNEPINLTVDIGLVLNQIVTPLTALLAGLVGLWLARTKQPAVTMPPPPPPIPPV